MSARNLVHYSNAAAITVESRRQEERPSFKPRGFWISDEDDETSWSAWCASEKYGRGKNAHRVALAADANLLWLRTPAEVVDFDAKFGEGRYGYIGWTAVAEQWSGIFITPYQWSLRLSDVGWYYPWDCASGCVWDAAAIASVAPLAAVSS